MNGSSYIIGMDVGSTTVKAVVSVPGKGTVWRDYQRHFTKQPEMVLQFLDRIREELGLAPEDGRLFVTGSGGAGLLRLMPSDRSQ